MDGRRINNHKERKHNPLFLLFLSLIAAVIVLLIVTVAMGTMLGRANRSLKTVESKVHELEQTIEQLEVDLEAERSRGKYENTPQVEPAESAPEQQPGEPPVQQPAQQPAQQESQSSGSWLDLSGHSEVKYKPSNLLSGYQTYYTSDGVNLRSGPATSYGRITTVNRGTAVQVAAREGNWSFVKVDGKFGWIRSDYLGKTTPAPETGTPAQSSTRTEATSGSLKTN